MHARRALVVGHFSTAGDIQCLEYIGRVLEASRVEHDVAPYNDKIRRRLPNSIDLRTADPQRYSHVVVVCGPCSSAIFAKNEFHIDRYRHCKWIGVNLTMIKPLREWNPFDVLLERDSDAAARPDLSFLVETDKVPVVGRCTIASQKEYGRRQRHREVISLFDSLIEQRELAIVDIDTRWPKQHNLTGLGSPAAVSSIIGRLDVLITNRLHGLVFALRNGVPALAVDSVEGGDKLSTQARVLEWPACLQYQGLTLEKLNRAFDWCLSEDARSAAKGVREQAVRLLGEHDRVIIESCRDGLVRSRDEDARSSDYYRPSNWRLAMQSLKRRLKMIN